MSVGARRVIGVLLTMAVMVTCTACNRVPQSLYDMKPYIYASLGDYAYEVGISHEGFLGDEAGNARGDFHKYLHGGDFVSETAASQTTVSLFGKSFTGEYAKSQYWGGSSYVTHRYEGQTEELGYYEFGVQEKTGTVMYISRPWATLESATVLSVSELQHLAEEFATQYIHLEDYAMTTSEYGEQITYKFTKDIGGRKTSEYFHITLLTDGSFGSFRMMDVGAYGEKYADELAVFADWTIEELAALTTAEEPNLEIKKIENVQYKITPWGEIVLLADIHYENSGIRSDKNHTAKQMAFLVEWKTPGVVSATLIFAAAILAVVAVGLTWMAVKRRRERVRASATGDPQNIVSHILGSD